jgi:uncharacterized membrane protein
VFDWLFQLFFEYRPSVFAQGELRFAPAAGAYLAAAVAAVALVIAAYSYRTRAARANVRDRVVLLSLRVALLGLVVLCLFRPVLVVTAAVPQQNVVGVLLDDSRSMQIADVDGAPRAEYVRREFGARESGTLRALSDKFLVRTFRFSRATSRLDDQSALTFEGGQTRLGAALESVRQELAGLPVAGLVVVSDGADTSESALGESLLGLRSAGVPVFTVGVGRETLDRDIQIGRVTTPRTVLKGTTLMIDVVVTAAGYAGETVTLDVEDEGRIVGSQEVRLPSDGSPATARVRVTAEEAGPRVFKFRVAPRPGELVTQNNAREALVDVRDRREKILYFEGEPRWEFKFVRRAVAEDTNLQVVALQRTADNKYLRLEVDSGDELVAGFPKTRDELFGYRGLILGSVEAGVFSGDQLRMLADFVDRRGGGFLMIGGARAFAEGGYAGTAIADVLPVMLERGGEEDPELTRISVRPTRAGAAEAVTQVANTEAASAAKWNELPGVTSVNRVNGVKPGATVLLSGMDEGRRESPVLVSQRYGRGRAFAFTIQDSYLWQMHASVAVDDMSHEHYWRQLLRSLVDGVPDAVEARTAADRVEPGESVALTADVVDRSFVELNDAAVIARVTGPDGATTDLPMPWTGERSGEYRVAVPTSAPGWYEARIEATRAGDPIGSAVLHLRAATGDSEYFDATMHAGTLRRIAEETGGRFYTSGTASGVAEDLRYTGRGVTSVEERELWHMPIVLLLIVALLCGEWAYRRSVGLS